MLEEKAYINKVIHGDCIIVLPNFLEESVPLVIADPPYFTAVKELLPAEIHTFDDYLVWYEKWVSEACRVLEKNGSMYVFIPPLEFAEVHAIIKKHFYQNSIISWAKPNVMVRQPTARTYFPKTEFIGFYTKDEKNRTWNRLIKKYGLQQSCDFMVEPTIYKGRGEGVGHPTQKPLRLCAKFVYASSNEGIPFLILFVGAGLHL